MTTERATLPSGRDGLKLSLIWTAPEAPLGFVLIVHGMAEHKERYIPLMEHLAGLGYACAAYDHRGHGESVGSQEDLGYFGKDGLKALVEDLKQVFDFFRSRWPGVPAFLLGHSMGSLVARAFMKRWPEADGLILSGSPSFQAAVRPAGALISAIKRLRGDRHRSALLNVLFFGAYNRKFLNPISPFAWLNSDAAAVEAYDRDPLCGFLFTVNGFAVLRSLLLDVYTPHGWAKPAKNVPVLFVSGGEDPCMVSREKLSEAANLLRNVGYAHVKAKVYDGMRHEILNEPQRHKVYADMAAFLEACCRSAKSARSSSAMNEKSGGIAQTPISF